MITLLAMTSCCSGRVVPSAESEMPPKSWVHLEGIVSESVGRISFPTIVASTQPLQTIPWWLSESSRRLSAIVGPGGCVPASEYVTATPVTAAAPVLQVLLQFEPAPGPVQQKIGFWGPMQSAVVKVG